MKLILILVALFSIEYSIFIPSAKAEMKPKSPESYLIWLEEQVNRYAKERIDLTSSGLSILCFKEKESCLNKEDKAHNAKCIKICQSYRKSELKSSPMK